MLCTQSTQKLQKKTIMQRIPYQISYNSRFQFQTIADAVYFYQALAGKRGLWLGAACVGEEMAAESGWVR